MASPSPMLLALSLVLSACALERTWADIESLEQATTTGTTETETTSSTETEPTEPSTTDPATTETTEPTSEPTTASTTTDVETDTDTTATTTTTTEPMCGNGQVEGDEECDDGNQNNDDACLNGCLKPYCGDGFFRPEDGEECDDGNQNDDDGCNAQCGRDRVVFVTNKPDYKGDLSGIVGATSACRSAALFADLDHYEGYLPWLSDDAYWPAMAFVHGKGRYVTVDGVVVADSWLDLVDGTLDAAIVIDEYGDLIGDVPVFTNTTIFGTPISLDTDCEGWTTIDFASKTYQGTSGETDERWTDYLPNPAPCGVNGHLYCFEQD
ncbi:MAG: DUF4215 domain-containing protein [Nannocystaceae bacterium]